MYEKINYKLVGLFVLLFSVAATYFGFWLSKSGVNRNNYNYYIAYFDESVDGLNKDSVVKLNGVDVGRVVKISVDNKHITKVRVDMAIRKGLKITDGMYAVLKSQGLTGLRYINIQSERKDGKTIEPNGENSVIKTKVSILADMEKSAPEALNKIVQFSQKLDLLLSDKNIDNFSKILENGAKATHKAVELEEKISSILGDNNGSVKSFVTTVKDLNRTVADTLNEYKKLARNGNIALDEINKKLPKLLSGLEKATKNISSASYLISKTIKRGDYNLNRILSPAMADLKDLIVKYKEVGDELKALAQNPGSRLLNGVKPPKGPGE